MIELIWSGVDGCHCQIKYDSMKKLLNIPNFYVLLWGLYYTQGTFLPRGSFYSIVVLLVFLGLSFFFFFRVTFAKNSPKYFQSLCVLLAMFAIYGVIHIVGSGGFDYLKPILLSLLPTYAFYYFSRNGMITDGWVRWSLLFFVFVTAVQYVAYQNMLYMASRTGEINSVVNVSYEVLSLFPLLFFFSDKKIIQYILLLLLLAAVVSTAKRGPFLIMVILLIIFLTHTLKYNKSSGKKTNKFFVLLLVVVFVFVGYRYVANQYLTNDYLQQRIEYTQEGGSSGRDIIFERCWDLFLNANTFEMIFGRGAASTVREIGIAAHNDWLEILVNQGLLGFVIYLTYWVGFVKTWHIEQDKHCKTILGSILVMLFMMTLFSMSYSAINLPINVCLGYCLTHDKNTIGSV